jgi:hypothetical protein
MKEPLHSPPPDGPGAASAGPVMDVVPPAPPTAETKTPPAKPSEQPSKPNPKATTPPKKPGVAAAIFATVIIVIALACLAVYAYIKQKG